MSLNFAPNDKLLKEELNKRLLDLEAYLKGDVLSFTGTINDAYTPKILGVIEDLAKSSDKKDALYIILTTPGGSAEAVERYVNIIRHHYNTVNFIVPNFAYSAGTIFCMSGDNIYMDYYSVLGPIDPQVQNKEGRWVAALGYLDKVKELLDKARPIPGSLNGTLTNAEFLILKDLDLAELRGYEQARDLSIGLLRNWLVKYKFKNWLRHETTQGLIGTTVTEEQKEARALEIAGNLSNTGIWKSHGRPIDMETLRENKLKIIDFGEDAMLNGFIRSYYEFLNDYTNQQIQKMPPQMYQHFNFLHTRTFI